MIPYFEQPILHLGPVTVAAFALCGVSAIAISCWTVLRRAAAKQLPTDPMFRLWFWSLAGAVVGGIAVVSAIRGRIGISSVGAISGGCAAGLLWFRFHRLSLLQMVERMDVMAYTLPLTWMTGRIGCALAHDHRGIGSASWMAVDFPEEGPRFDLGLLECLFLAGLAMLFRFLDSNPRPAGFFAFWLAVACVICRLWLDTLRIGPDYLDVAVPAAAALAIGLAMRRPRRAD